MPDPSVVSAIRNYMKAVNHAGILVRFAVLFGSHVTGGTDRWSDIDVIVVSPQFDEPRDRRNVDLLWHLAARTDSRIEPIPCGERQWKEDASSAIVEMARREGESITLTEES